MILSKRITEVTDILTVWDGAANDKLMMKWFQKMTLQEFQRKQEIPEFTAVRTALEKVFASITGFSDVKVQYNPDTGGS